MDEQKLKNDAFAEMLKSLKTILCVDPEAAQPLLSLLSLQYAYQAGRNAALKEMINQEINNKKALLALEKRSPEGTKDRESRPK